MQNFLRISEAVSLAFHSMGLLASRKNEVLRTSDIAKTLAVSEHHLQKVHHRLAKAGFIQAVRGPKGGFRIDRPAHEITLIEIFQALEGPLDPCACMMGRPSCEVQDCVLGDLVDRVNSLVREHLENCTVEQLSHIKPQSRPEP
jgi:Rrf2 family protein